MKLFWGSIALVGVILCVHGSPKCFSTPGGDTFVGSESSWYNAVTYCALVNPISSPSDLYTCLNSLTVDQPDPTASLTTAFANDPSESSLADCFYCIFEYSKKVTELYSGYEFFVRDKCLVLIDDLQSIWAYSEELIRSAECQLSLF